MWIITNHTVTYHNENLFLANPLTLLLLPLGISEFFGSKNCASRASRLWYGLAAFALLGLLLKLPIRAFDQDNGRAVALILPILLGGAATSFWLRRRA
jgi:hypothetical protein